MVLLITFIQFPLPPLNLNTTLGKSLDFPLSPFFCWELKESGFDPNLGGKRLSFPAGKELVRHWRGFVHASCWVTELLSRWCPYISCLNIFKTYRESKPFRLASLYLSARILPGVLRNGSVHLLNYITKAVYFYNHFESVIV